MLQSTQSGSERAFDFMAKYGIHGVIGSGSAEGGAVERHMLGSLQPPGAPFGGGSASPGGVSP